MRADPAQCSSTHEQGHVATAIPAAEQICHGYTDVPSAPRQQLPSVSPSMARQLASELADAVQLPQPRQDQSSTASAPVAQGIAAQPQSPLFESLPPASEQGPHSEDNAHKDDRYSSSSLHVEAAEQDAVIGEPAEGDEGLSIQPLLASSPDVQQQQQLTGSTPELQEAIRLSLSQVFLPGALSDPGEQLDSPRQNAEMPSVPASPIMQSSASLADLSNAVRASSRVKCLDDAESAALSESSPSPGQRAEVARDSPLTQLPSPASAPLVPSTSSASVKDAESWARSVAELSPHLAASSASDPHPCSSASQLSQHPKHLLQLQEEEPDVSHSSYLPLPSTPGSDKAEQAWPESQQPEAGSNSPVHIRAVPNSPVSAHDTSPMRSHTHTPQKGPPAEGAEADPSLASTSAGSTPAPASSSSSPQPPKPSPGTAAQIDGDAALAIRLHQLELGGESAEADSSAAAAPADALDDVDLAALHDVEVPLVGDQLPLAALMDDYEGSPRVCGNLANLMQRFPYFRRIRGDWL